MAITRHDKYSDPPATSPTPPAPGAPTPETMTLCVECGHAQEHHRGRNPKGHCTVCWQASVRELQQGYCRRFIAPQSLCATCPQPSLCTAKMLDGEHNVCELTALPPDIETALDEVIRAERVSASSSRETIQTENACADARRRLTDAILRALAAPSETAMDAERFRVICRYGGTIPHNSDIARVRRDVDEFRRDIDAARAVEGREHAE